eukprot:1796292-Amphidinium_carterae.2
MAKTHNSPREDTDDFEEYNEIDTDKMAYACVQCGDNVEHTLVHLLSASNNGTTTMGSQTCGQSSSADGKTIKPEYVTADNGPETDHRAAMSLHKLHNEKDSLVTNSRATMRISTGPDMQLRRRATILNAQITMHVENDNEDLIDNDDYND